MRVKGLIIVLLLLVGLAACQEDLTGQAFYPVSSEPVYFNTTTPGLSSEVIQDIAVKASDLGYTTPRDDSGRRIIVGYAGTPVAENLEADITGYDGVIEYVGDNGQEVYIIGRSDTAIEKLLEVYNEEEFFVQQSCKKIQLNNEFYSADPCPAQEIMHFPLEGEVYDTKTGWRADKGVPTGDGVVGNGVRLAPGSDIEITPLRTISDGDTSFSFTAWIKVDNTQTHNIFTLCGEGPCDDTESAGVTLATTINQGYLYYSVEDLGGPFYNQNIANDKWQHVAVTSDAITKEIVLYINSTEVARTILEPEQPRDHEMRFFLGSSPYWDSFDGHMDEVHIFDGILSQDEIEQIYQSELLGARASGSSGLVNGDFEDGTVGWTVEFNSGWAANNIQATVPVNGQIAAKLGSVLDADQTRDTNLIYQYINVTESGTYELCAYGMSFYNERSSPSIAPNDNGQGYLYLGNNIGKNRALAQKVLMTGSDTDWNQFCLEQEFTAGDEAFVAIGAKQNTHTYIVDDITFEMQVAPVCGNDVCEEGEFVFTCPADCGTSSDPICGNGIVDTYYGAEYDSAGTLEEFPITSSCDNPSYIPLVIDEEIFIGNTAPFVSFQYHFFAYTNPTITLISPAGTQRILCAGMDEPSIEGVQACTRGEGRSEFRPNDFFGENTLGEWRLQACREGFAGSTNLIKTASIGVPGVYIISEEECDDGNSNNYDSCSNSCTDNTCRSDSDCGSGQFCYNSLVCPRGLSCSQEGDLLCHNTCSSDSDCAIGEICKAHSIFDGSDNSDRTESFCVAGERAPICGNSMIEEDEQCDDGNTLDGDGCSASCLSEDVVCEDTSILTEIISGRNTVNGAEIFIENVDIINKYSIATMEINGVSKKFGLIDQLHSDGFIYNGVEYKSSHTVGNFSITILRVNTYDWGGKAVQVAVANNQGNCYSFCGDNICSEDEGYSCPNDCPLGNVELVSQDVVGDKIEAIFNVTINRFPLHTPSVLGLHENAQYISPISAPGNRALRGIDKYSDYPINFEVSRDIVHPNNVINYSLVLMEDWNVGNTRYFVASKEFVSININPICGDGIVDEGEQCDDGNALSADGCTRNCLVEVCPLPTCEYRFCQDTDVLFGQQATVFDYDNNGALDYHDVNLLQFDIIPSQICPESKDCDIDNNGLIDSNDVGDLHQLFTGPVGNFCRSSCQNNICDAWEDENSCPADCDIILPGFIIALSERGANEDILLSVDVLEALGFSTPPVGSVELFNEIDALSDLHNQITLAIYENESYIIVGRDSSLSQVDFASRIDTIVSHFGVESTTILSSNISSSDLHDLFNEQQCGDLICSTDESFASCPADCHGTRWVTLDQVPDTTNSALFTFQTQGTSNKGIKSFTTLFNDQLITPISCQEGAAHGGYYEQITCTYQYNVTQYAGAYVNISSTIESNDILTNTSSKLVFVNITQPVVCGAELNTDTILTEDLVCNSWAFTLSSSDIELDCNGHTIKGPFSNDIIGVRMSSGSTVKNCNFEGFDSAISAYGKTDLTIANNTINGTRSRGLFLGQSENVVITNNIITNSGIPFDLDDGVFYTIYDNILINNKGILSANNVTNSLIYRNQFAENTGFNGVENQVSLFASSNIFWNDSNSGNQWSDFEDNSGYPTQYIIDAQNIDYKPEGAGDIETVDLRMSAAAATLNDQTLTRLVIDDATASSTLPSSGTEIEVRYDPESIQITQFNVHEEYTGTYSNGVMRFTTTYPYIYGQSIVNITWTPLREGTHTLDIIKADINRTATNLYPVDITNGRVIGQLPSDYLQIEGEDYRDLSLSEKVNWRTHFDTEDNPNFPLFAQNQIMGTEYIERIQVGNWSIEYGHPESVDDPILYADIGAEKYSGITYFIEVRFLERMDLVAAGAAGAELTIFGTQFTVSNLTTQNRLVLINPNGDEVAFVSNQRVEINGEDLDTHELTIGSPFDGTYRLTILYTAADEPEEQDRYIRAQRTHVDPLFNNLGLRFAGPIESITNPDNLVLEFSTSSDVLDVEFINGHGHQADVELLSIDGQQIVYGEDLAIQQDTLVEESIFFGQHPEERHWYDVVEVDQASGSVLLQDQRTGVTKSYRQGDKVYNSRGKVLFEIEGVNDDHILVRNYLYDFNLPYYEDRTIFVSEDSFTSVFEVRDIDTSNQEVSFRNLNTGEEFNISVGQTIYDTSYTVSSIGTGQITLDRPTQDYFNTQGGGEVRLISPYNIVVNSLWATYYPFIEINTTIDGDGDLQINARGIQFSQAEFDNGDMSGLDVNGTYYILNNDKDKLEVYNPIEEITYDVYFVAYPTPTSQLSGCCCFPDGYQFNPDMTQSQCDVVGGIFSNQESVQACLNYCEALAGPTCGNGQCEQGEDASSCPADCATPSDIQIEVGDIPSIIKTTQWTFTTRSSSDNQVSTRLLVDDAEMSQEDNTCLVSYSAASGIYTDICYFTINFSALDQEFVNIKIIANNSNGQIQEDVRDVFVDQIAECGNNICEVGEATPGCYQDCSGTVYVDLLSVPITAQSGDVVNFTVRGTSGKGIEEMKLYINGSTYPLSSCTDSLYGSYDRRTCDISWNTALFANSTVNISATIESSNALTNSTGTSIFIQAPECGNNICETGEPTSCTQDCSASRPAISTVTQYRDAVKAAPAEYTLVIGEQESRDRWAAVSLAGDFRISQVAIASEGCPTENVIFVGGPNANACVQDYIQAGAFSEGDQFIHRWGSVVMIAGYEEQDTLDAAQSFMDIQDLDALPGVNDWT